MLIYAFPFASPAYDASVQLRMDILRTPLGLDFTVADLQVEFNCYHLGVFTNYDKLIACMVLEPNIGDVFKMRQVAVALAWQGKGVGKALVLASEQFVRDIGASKMMMHARETAVPFYKKLDYKIVGDRFEEVSLPHFKMEKEI